MRVATQHIGLAALIAGRRRLYIGAKVARGGMGLWGVVDGMGFEDAGCECDVR